MPISLEPSFCALRCNPENGCRKKNQILFPFDILIECIAQFLPQSNVLSYRLSADWAVNFRFSMHDSTVKGVFSSIWHSMEIKGSPFLRNCNEFISALSFHSLASNFRTAGNKTNNAIKWCVIDILQKKSKDTSMECIVTFRLVLNSIDDEMISLKSKKCVNKTISRFHCWIKYLHCLLCTDEWFFPQSTFVSKTPVRPRFRYAFSTPSPNFFKQIIIINSRSHSAKAYKKSNERQLNLMILLVKLSKSTRDALINSSPFKWFRILHTKPTKYFHLNRFWTFIHSCGDIKLST